MLFGLLLDEVTLADVVAEVHTTGNRAVQVVTAPLWMALLSLYSLSTFLSLLTAGFLSKIAPTLFTPLFETLLDKVSPTDSSYSGQPTPFLQPGSSCSSINSTGSGGESGNGGRKQQQQQKHHLAAAAGGGASRLQVPQ